MSTHILLVHYCASIMPVLCFGCGCKWRTNKAAGCIKVSLRSFGGKNSDLRRLASHNRVIFCNIKVWHAECYTELHDADLVQFFLSISVANMSGEWGLPSLRSVACDVWNGGQWFVVSGALTWMCRGCKLHTSPVMYLDLVKIDL